jgi:hypothetical protein
MSFLMGITRAQIASLRGKIERLSSHLEDGEKVYVPVYKGETRDEAILEFERQFGPTPIARMWLGSDNWRTREEVVGSPLHMPGITRSQLKLLAAFLDGKTRGIPNAAYFERAGQGREPSKQHISGEQAIDDEDKRDGALPG